jgi:hypothetical protein
LSLPADADLGTVRFRPSIAYRKFQDRKWLHALLFLATAATTTLVGALHYLNYAADFGRRSAQASIWDGLWYSATIIAILGAHEFGHYVMCRRYNVDASLPYFIPLLFPGAVPIQTGTLGAVIRIREAFPTRQALFDIGVAGPIAGFLVLVPAFFIGLALSNVVTVPSNIPLINLGEPLLFKAGVKLVFGDVPSGSTVNMHPMVFACWFGMLATALNLLPFGQLDGGHLTYATLGRWATPLSLVTVASGVVMTFFTSSWMVFTFMMMVMLILFGPRHPTVIYDDPLPRSRVWVAVFALVMLIICISPVPMELIFPNTPAPPR